jgi:uncharacterized protein (TIGR03083 family)
MMDVIAAGRRELAEVLGGLSPDQWQAPSLCTGWTIAHVAAHMTMPFRISGEEFMQGVAQAGGDFTAFSDAVASRDSQLPQAELVTALRDNINTPWSPPGGGLAGALSHDVIHGLDIIWPLDIKNPIPDQAMISVLDMLAGQGGQNMFGLTLDGIRFQASDPGWSSGTGEPLTGQGRDLVPLLAGRAIPHDMFGGAGVQRLAAANR